ncbi:MAG: hypothetical protein UHN47_06855 [Lachnospiraceae bacterium]|nr:hypothetical protein [Lachnospiraceae bacterium]
MRKKVCALLTVFTLILASSITAFAAPEVMPDGGVFDAEYYAQNNPDVVAAFGTDKELLYSHYVNNGRAEGRLAVAPEAQNVPTQDAQAEANIALMEEVYNKVISISKENLDEFYAYMLANLDTIRNACTFVESKDCPTLYDGIPVYTVYYYTYVAKDGQRLNMIVNEHDRHYMPTVFSSDSSKPTITLEFLVDQEIVDGSRPNINLAGYFDRSEYIQEYEHYVLLENITSFRSDKNYYINNGRYCHFLKYPTAEGGWRFHIQKDEEARYFGSNIKANSYVEFWGIHVGTDMSRVTHTR